MTANVTEALASALGTDAETLRAEIASNEAALQAEVARLTKIVRKQGAETRRLTAAYAKLKNEKRDVHEIIAVAEQLQDEIETLEARIAVYESGEAVARMRQAAESSKRSREALAIRYGRLYRFVAALDTADARAVLTDVDDRKWVRAQLAEQERSD